VTVSTSIDILHIRKAWGALDGAPLMPKFAMNFGGGLTI
jgi:hypothetical protein